MLRNFVWMVGVLVPFMAPMPGLAQENLAAPKAPSDEQAVRQVSASLVRAFNAADVKQVQELFFESADLTDDAGAVHRGRSEIVKLMEQFFAKFPGAKSTMTTDSVWLVGPGIAIQEGQRAVTTRDGKSAFASRYTLVLMKEGGRWKIASAKETEDDTGLTAHQRLVPLAWLVGEWIDESPDAVVKISCRWSEDKNYLLADYNTQLPGKKALKSQQRIGWDPLTQKVKSWVFDSDGGHGEASWTPVESRWLVKSSAVFPDGKTGSAMLTFEPRDKDTFMLKGTDRLQGDTSLPDFEIPIVRKPPEPSK